MQKFIKETIEREITVCDWCSTEINYAKSELGTDDDQYFELHSFCVDDAALKALSQKNVKKEINDAG